jgi:hypothetical protein
VDKLGLLEHNEKQNQVAAALVVVVVVVVSQERLTLLGWQAVGCPESESVEVEIDADETHGNLAM